MLDYPPWSEEEVAWFLEELNRPDRPRGYLVECAKALKRDLKEVQAEKKRLTELGFYRSPGRASVQLG